MAQSTARESCVPATQLSVKKRMRAVRSSVARAQVTAVRLGCEDLVRQPRFEVGTALRVRSRGSDLGPSFL